MTPTVPERGRWTLWAEESPTAPHTLSTPCPAGNTQPERGPSISTVDEEAWGRLVTFCVCPFCQWAQEGLEVDTSTCQGTTVGSSQQREGER